MFALTIFLGIFSNLIFMLGIVGILYKQLVIIVTIISFFIFLVIYKKTEVISLKPSRFDWLSKIILALILIQALVNLIGVLGPEIGFDALWYHLTLPKIFLMYHKIFHIPGGLLYYSDMPKLGETFYISALSFGNEILAKLIHFSFGLLCLIPIYRIGEKYTSKKFALLACLIFYSNLVVGWESISAYIDLIRTFFEITAFWAFIEWAEKKDNKLLYESAVMVGLAVSTKLIALGSLIIFAVLIAYQLRKRRESILSTIVKYILIVLFVASPWFVYSFLNTGNPVYPIFTSFYSSGFSFNALNPIVIIKTIFSVFLNSSDPLSPIYIIFFPLIFIFSKKIYKKYSLIFIYSFISIVVWYITPQTGGGRFLLPYLPVLSIVCVILIDSIGRYKKYLIFLIVFISITSIGYRAIANSKFIPVILGTETKNQFLAKKLNYGYGDFYDVDNFLKDYLTATDRVLLYGFHNLYYVDFPFVDASYVTPGDTFNYIATQNTSLPARFSNMKLIYSNRLTKVSLYSDKGKRWEY